MAVSVVPCAVIRMIGSRGLAACSWRTSSRPSKPGSFKSVRTRSNDSRRRAGQAGVAARFHDDFMPFVRQHASAV